MKTEIHLHDGKYTVVFDNGKLEALRYGEPWRDLTGDNLIYWMMCEIQDLREQLAQFEAPPLEPATQFQKRPCQGGQT